MLRTFSAAALLLLAGTAGAETITLKDGTRLEGEITGEMDGVLSVTTKYGSLTIKRTDIAEAPAAPAQEAPVQKPSSKLTFSTLPLENGASQVVYSADGVITATQTLSSSGITLGTEGEIKDGTYSEFYPGGQVKTERPMASGKIEGQYRSLFENGTVQTEAFYAAGALDGRVVIRGENGAMQFEQNFRKGQPHGWFRQYDAQGNVKSETEYADGKPLENPKWTDLPAEGEGKPGEKAAQEPVMTARSQRLARVERVSFYLNGKYTGRLGLDKDFNIVSRDGKLPDGEVKVYSRDGKLEKEFVFSAGEPASLSVYEPGGPVKASYNFREGRAIRK